MILYQCDNFVRCGNYVTKPDHICEDCKKESITLSHQVEYNARLERLSYVDKNEGLRRHRKGGGR